MYLVSPKGAVCTMRLALNMALLTSPVKCKESCPDVISKVKRFGLQNSVGCNSVWPLNALVVLLCITVPVNILILLMKEK